MDDLVSILVLMDLAFEYQRKSTNIQELSVSILVLMDLAFESCKTNVMLWN